MKLKLIVLCSTLLSMLLVFKNLNAQTIGDIQCGDIVEGEIVAGQSQTIERDNREKYVDEYALDIQAGTRINLTVEPLGTTFNAAFVLVDSGGNDVLLVNHVVEGEAEQVIDFSLGSSNQILRILGAAPGHTDEDDEACPTSCFYSDNNIRADDAGSYFGAYQITLGCTLRDGTVIEPGDTVDDSEPRSCTIAVLCDDLEDTEDIISQVPVPSFGFPGLAPVDFANAFRLPLTFNSSIVGEIPPAGDAVLGFRFDGTAGDTLELSFERTSGNLNLGLAVLSADNQVAYMAALVSSQTMSSRFSLPSTSEYTIGIFRIDLIPPAAPEATAFQITAVLNP